MIGSPFSDDPQLQRLHLGCGRTILEGWVNLDRASGPGVDMVADLDRCAEVPLPFSSDTFDEFLASHVFEHLHHPLPLMHELHRIAKPGAKAVFRVPYGSSDDAYEDPTHVRHCFMHTFSYFSQPFYWRADYGYRGDWQPQVVHLTVSKQRYLNMPPEQIMDDINRYRNVVREMIVELTAIKPIRPPRRELQSSLHIDIMLVDAL